MAINVSQAFKRTSIAPIDETLALTKAQMVSTVDTLMPAYYFTICQDDGKIYLYDKTATPSVTTGKFKEFSGGGGGGSSDVQFFTTTDTLNKTINGTKVVAAADLPGVTWSDLVVGSSVIKDAKGTMGLVTAITGTTSVTVTTATTSAHTIIDTDGNPVADELKLQFTGLDVQDNSTDSETEVSAFGLNADSLDDIIDSANIPANPMATNGLVYSTTEQIVGRWIDGKPLYQKTFVTTSPSAPVAQIISKIADDYETCVNFWGIMHGSSVNRMVTGSTIGGNHDEYIELWSNGNNIWACVDSTHYSKPLYVTVQYTKTS